MSTAHQLPPVYEPGQVEHKWYKFWKDRNYFAPNENTDKPMFSIVMPPPNVTGSLHLGHALDNTLQDILTRWRRMQGYNVLWLPGTDHAGIATQAKVEEALSREGLSRYDLGREKFVERVWEWKHLYGSRITEQLSLLGSSCDWSRERFTMDEGCSRAVREVFVNLYNKGLIYQGDYIINWCPKCKTAISDIEVEHEDTSGKLWYIRYPIENADDYLVVATTRPETMLGDTGVAVHPEDERYRHLIGRNVILPLMNRPIPVFADEYVDKEFGTGAVKVTPAHDPNDFEMGLRHNLAQIKVMSDTGIMNENAGSYQGLDRFECRKRVVDDLEDLGLLVKVEEHQHAVGHCQRCDTIIEPMISKQWFVRMKPLAEPAIRRVKEGDIRFVPERFTKIYLNWMENIRDWCISRQLWWGHRIPVWYCDECGEVICSKTDPDHCPSCNSDKLRQDEDVLDTWFSSALWPFSTMGWPDNTRDLQTFYPTSVLVTGRDIIFFWVARMIFSGLEHTGQVPFYDINIHGLILDAQGRKMSKSLGNGIDPIEVIEKYGADTLRFALITGVTPGNDVRFHWEKVENTRNFANKIWNAARFVLMNMEGYKPQTVAEQDLTLADRWIISRLGITAEEVTQLLEKYDLGEAAKTLYEFIWDEFCDWYIELVKLRLGQNADPGARQIAQNVLLQVLIDILRLLHPFMPFITEEIYQNLPRHNETIMLDPWPAKDEVWSQAMEDMQQLMSVIRSLRNIRAEFNIAPGTRINTILLVRDTAKIPLVEDNREYIRKLAQVEQIKVVNTLDTKPSQAVSALTAWCEIYVPLEGVIDIEREILRLEKELKTAETDLQKAESKLGNATFLTRAPEEVIAKEKAKAEEARVKKEGILQRLEILKQS
ncbi:MAG TPA: valine--tRNA ligase [Syntrophomonadaceae bacterium]|nr:valine--tRNA ligase [Syntrophomonadaceae bacterium]HQE22914.1 valine--tRNA ligase [Syntrophomonadaceae bacterium]